MVIRPSLAILVEMADKLINLLLTSFSGLNLPQTLALSLPSCTPIRDVRHEILSRLPPLEVRYVITTLSRRELSPTSAEPVSSLLQNLSRDFLPLRIVVPLRGGKGGFGSQLRAAGGRMASRKRRNQGENNGSSRNLDGRRLRTVTEAKALAEYLATKSDMETRERDARRRRWQEAVEVAERRDEEIRSGGKAKVDGQWVEDKEEAAERTREAVRAVMLEGNNRYSTLSPMQAVMGSHSNSLESSSLSGEVQARDTPIPIRGPSNNASDTSTVDVQSTVRFFGFDEEEDSDSKEEHEFN